MRLRPLLASPLCAALFAGSPGCDYKADEGVPQRVERGWTVVWEDEFEGDAGARPDASRWTFDLGRGESGWGNNELQTYTDGADNVALTGSGELAITARAEARDGAEYTSARVKTQGLFATTYGRVEARIKLPSGAGIWPAFWMLGEDVTTVGWPRSGEIDIMELRGQEPDVVAGTLHGPGFSGGNPISDEYFLPDGERFDEGFHVFAVEWDPGRVAWFVDDVLYSIVTSAQVPAGGDWVFDHPFFIILNVAVGGNYVGPPNAATSFPQTMLVDWVRVLARTP